jgi:hypothetical protein
MNREDIEQWTREAGGFDVTPEFLAKFAALVASAEREACAKVCDDLDDDLPDGLAGWQYGEAIRARGQA